MSETLENYLGILMEDLLQAHVIYISDENQSGEYFCLIRAYQESTTEPSSFPCFL